MPHLHPHEFVCRSRVWATAERSRSGQVPEIPASPAIAKHEAAFLYGSCMAVEID
jgi:hypothetical protein